MRVVGLVLLLGGAVALMYGLRVLLDGASATVDRLLGGVDDRACFDDPADFDLSGCVDAARDEVWERLAAPDDVFGLAGSVGFDSRLAAELVVAEAEAILAGERP